MVSPVCMYVCMYVYRMSDINDITIDFAYLQLNKLVGQGATSKVQSPRTLPVVGSLGENWHTVCICVCMYVCMYVCMCWILGVLGKVPAKIGCSETSDSAWDHSCKLTHTYSTHIQYIHTVYWVCVTMTWPDIGCDRSVRLRSEDLCCADPP